MSRWDGLNTDASQKTSKSKYRWPNSGNQQQSDLQRRSTKKVRSYADILAALRDAQQPGELESLFCEIAGMKVEFFQRIPAEQAAIDLVGGFVLPKLQSVDISVNLENSIMNAVDTLVCVPSMCCAIFSPLTVDVALITGSERRISNPVGEPLFQALQLRLPQSCSTLIRVVDEIRKRSIADTLKLDTFRLEQFFATQMNVESSQAQCLDLLRLVLVTYPGSYMTFKSLLLTDVGKQLNATPCLACRYLHGSSTLLTLLHGRICTTQVTTCIALFLKLFPLDAWLNAKTVGSMKLFVDNVKTNLIQLIRILACRFSVSEDFCKLITVVLMVIPYNADIDDCMTREAMLLTSCVAKAVVNRMSHIHAIECLCECMGGRPSPSGAKTLTSIPVSLWLFETSTFQEYIFGCFDDVDTPSKGTAIKLLCAIIRTQPGFVTWGRFQSLVQDLISTDKHRGEGMMLLEAFAVGRSQFDSSIPNWQDKYVSMFLIRVFNEVALDQLIYVRLSCLRGYCALIPADWSFAVESKDMEICLDHLIRFSRHGTTSEKPLALKAIGEMLSKCSSSPAVDDSELVHVCITVMPTLEGCLKESAQVACRAMANFAIGNLALGIRERHSPQALILPDVLLHLLEKSGACIDSSTDKVSGNAIRTVGHIGILAFREPYASLLSTSQADERFRTIVMKLVDKVRNAMSGNDSPGLTWKQRSIANKHGWGSCHSLGLLVDSDVALRNLDESRESCRVLIRCLSPNNGLTEKTVIAAIAALTRWDKSILEELSRGAGLTGMIVSSCIQWIISISINCRIRTELERLLLHAVPILSVMDVYEILQTEDMTSSHLEWLYNWMMTNDMNAEPYEKFAIAFEQTNCWDSNVGLEQRFASRAAWGYRERSSEKADDEDEL